MDLMKDIYKKELRTRIAAWEGKKTDDFQYEPERAELKAQMKDWLAEKLGVDDEKKLLIANRKYFATCMAELVYEETVRPNMKDFIQRNSIPNQVDAISFYFIINRKLFTCSSISASFALSCSKFIM